MSRFGGEGMMFTPERLSEMCHAAAEKNIIASVHDDVFPGFFAVTADAVDFGRNNSYPALDGHHMTDALLMLGKVETVKQNFDYVLRFQRSNGQLPFAVLPDLAGKSVGPSDATADVDRNGGLYRHWVPGDPLRASPYTTIIQNAEVIYLSTQDAAWLRTRLPGVNLAADFLLGMVDNPRFTTVSGDYNGNPAWSGSVWTMINDAVIRALQDAGEPGHAAELAYKTIVAFRGNYSEFLNPFSGEGHGVKQYAWTASQWIRLLIEVVFGVCCNAFERTITLRPHLTKEMMKEHLSLSNLRLPDGATLDVSIDRGRVSCRTDSKFKLVC